MSAAPKGEFSTARALVELTRSTGDDWDAAIRRILQFDAESLGVERVSIWSLNEERSTLRCDAG